MPVDPRRSHYKLLMVDPSADRQIIGAVYRKLAQRYHPDIDSSPEAARKMAEINDAYAVLRDPVKRAKYDAEQLSRRDRRAGDRIIRRAGEGGYGSAGIPVGPAEGSVIQVGRYSGWTLGQIKRADPDFLEWLMSAPSGRQYRNEIQALLTRSA